MGKNPDKEWSPGALGVCEDCGDIYPMRETPDGWLPVGTDGSCRCGGTEFSPTDVTAKSGGEDG